MRLVVGSALLEVQLLLLEVQLLLLQASFLHLQRMLRVRPLLLLGLLLLLLLFLLLGQRLALLVRLRVLRTGLLEKGLEPGAAR